MKVLKSYIALALAVTMLLILFTSCSKAEDLTGAADAALAEKAYTVDMKIVYESDNEQMAEAIAAFSSPTLKLKVDGDDFDARMEMKKGDAKSYIEYVYVDGVLYTEVSNGTVSASDSSAIEGLDSSEITDKLGAGAGIDRDDFDKARVQIRGEVSIITYTGLDSESIEALNGELSDKLEHLGLGVELSDAKLEIELNGGEYRVTILTCEYTVTDADESYTLTMTLAAEFDYDTEFVIVAP